MNASQSMTVARRLSLGFGLIILVLIAMVTVTLVGLSTINQQIYEITQINALQGRLATKMVDSAQEMRVQYRQLLLENDPAKKKESAARLSKAREAYLKALALVDVADPQHRLLTLKLIEAGGTPPHTEDNT